MKSRLLPLATAVLLAFPAAAQADVYTFGVDVDSTGPATLQESHQADTLFFNPPGQANTTATPVGGEVTQVRIKGTIVGKTGAKAAQSLEPLYRLFHIQTLHPESNGSYTVTSSTQHLYFPVNVDPNTVTRFAAESPQCVSAGDVVDFNNVGGWDGDASDPAGTTYKIFGSAPGLKTYWYERNDGTNIGSNWLPNRQVDSTTGAVNTTRGPIADRQLLMQVTVATGYDAAVNCPGGRKGFQYRGVTLETPSPAPKVYDDGIARVRVTCPAQTWNGCTGALRLEAEGQLLASSNSFSLGVTEATNIQLKLTNAGANMLATRGTIDATATAETRDGWDVGKITTGTVRLTSARPATSGYAGTQAKAQVATVTQGKEVTLKATCPASTLGSCAGTLTAQNQKRIALKASDKRGNLYKMATGSFDIPSGKTVRFPIKLTASGLKVLKARRTIVAIATLASHDGAGRKHSERVKVTFKYAGR